EVFWSFTPNSPETQFETIYGDDQTWAYLSTLEPSPILTFGAPVITTQLPIGGSAHGVYNVIGSVAGGSLPVYVRILFYPRQTNLFASNLISGQTVQLSIFNVIANTVEVFTDTKVFTQGTDYTISPSSILTVVPAGALPGNSVTIL